MKTQTVNISFSDSLLRDIDSVSREEARSRSELIREAARVYITKKRVWGSIFHFAEKHAKTQGLKESDINGAISKYRRKKG